MKKLAFLLAICLLLPLLCACDKKSEETKWLLTEEVVTETNQWGDEKHSITSSKTQYTYDKNGLLIKLYEERPTTSGYPITTEFENDKNGRVIRKTLRNEKGNITEDWRYSYDEAGRVLTEDQSTMVKHVSTVTWTYDAKGRPLSAITKYHGNSSMEFPNEQTLYTYDDEKRSCVQEDSQYGKILHRYETVYDASGRILTKSTYFPKSDGEIKLSRKESYTYDDKTTTITSETNGSVTTITYNDRGQVLQEITLQENNKASNTITYTYDDHGNLIRKEDIRTSTSSVRTLTTDYTYKTLQEVSK